MRWLTKLTLWTWLILALVAQGFALARPAAASPAASPAPVVPGQFMIKFKSGTPDHERAAVVQAQGGHFFDRIADLDVDAAEFPALKNNSDQRASEALVNALKHNPNVEYAEPNYIGTLAYTPNDPFLSRQYAWGTIQAYSAWNKTRGSASTVIAIVDSGIQRDHPDLDAKIVAGYDYVQNDDAPDDGAGHGTHVAGIAAAETNNSEGVAGTCPDCKLMPVRVSDKDDFVQLLNAANGILYAADHGARVINLSWKFSIANTTLQAAVDYAWNRGAFLACGAGNDSSSTPVYPAAYNHCFAVASTDSSDALSSFSNYGNWVAVAAPGQAIYSTMWPGTSLDGCRGRYYCSMDGTSMATPHVAGLAGLLASQGLSNELIRDRICRTADKINGTNSLWTCGRINAYRAVNNVDGMGFPVLKLDNNKLFMTTADGRLMERYWDASRNQWGWTDHGTPPGTRVATAPGALIVDLQNTITPYKFFVGTADGRLFEHYWYTPTQQWLWADRGRPAGTSVTTAPGALIADPQNAITPYKFFVGTADGRLFEHYWYTPTQQWLWSDRGRPVGTSVATAPGALIADLQNTITPYKFFVGTADGRLFEHYWYTPTQQWLWGDRGRPVGTSVATAPGALISDLQNTITPYKFFVGTADGRLFEHYWYTPTQQWLWGDRGRPVGTSVATAPGALISDLQNTITPYKFFVGTADGRLFEHYWYTPTQQWLWADRGRPAGTSVTTAPGALIADPQNAITPYKFFVGTADGRLFEHYWYTPTQQWLWGDHGRNV